MYSFYCLRENSFCFKDITASTIESISKAKSFQFDQSQIVKLRTYMKNLLSRLSEINDVRLSYKKRKKAEGEIIEIDEGQSIEMAAKKRKNNASKTSSTVGSCTGVLFIFHSI